MHVLSVVLPQLVDHHVDEARAGHGAELVEGREEFVVIGRYRDGRHERPCRERIDQTVVQVLIVHGVGDGHVSGLIALRLREKDVGEVRAEILLRGPGDEALRVNGTGQVGMEIATLRHAMEEGAQRRAVIASGFEPGCRDDRVEFAGDHSKAQQNDEGRHENDGKNDPTPQDLIPLCSLQREASGWMCRTQSEAPRFARAATVSMLIM